MSKELNRQQSAAARAASGSSPPTPTRHASRRRQRIRAQPVEGRAGGSVPTLRQVATTYRLPLDVVERAFSDIAEFSGPDADLETVMYRVQDVVGLLARVRPQMERLQQRAFGYYRSMLAARAKGKVS